MLLWAVPETASECCFCCVIFLKCKFSPPDVTCGSSELSCKDGSCVPSSAWCNQVIDCADASDEKNCSKSFTLCFTLQFKCMFTCKLSTALTLEDEMDPVTQICACHSNRIAYCPPLYLHHQRHCEKALTGVLCFVFRQQRLLSLLQAGGERKRFHQLQLHLAVYPPFMDLWWCKRLWGLCWWDQLSGWAPNIHTLLMHSEAKEGRRLQLEKT